MAETDNLLLECQSKYGENLGEIFYYLRNDHADLWLTYKQYRSLFGTNKERVDLLNKHAGSFFFNVERQFWNSCILSICKLTDPAKQGKNKNLTLYSLLDYIEDEDLKRDVASLVDEAKRASEFARERRNKKIGHSDFEIRSNKSQLQTTASRKKMNDAIEASHKPLSHIAFKLQNTDMRPSVIDSLPNEMNLLHSLYDAEFGKEVLRQKRRDKFKNAEPSDKFNANHPYPDWLNWKQEL